MIGGAAGGERIALCDPDPTFRAVLGAYLRERGYAVEPLADGRALLARFDQLDPALVITDLAGEDLDGLELVRELRRAARPPLVLLCTRLRAVERWSRPQLDELGIAGVVVRPATFPALAERIAALLAEARAEHEPTRVVVNPLLARPQSIEVTAVTEITAVTEVTTPAPPPMATPVPARARRRKGKKSRSR